MGQQTATPAILSDLQGGILNLFTAIGDGTPIQVGKEYLRDFGLGTGPKVLLVPELRGKTLPALRIGGREVASVQHSVLALVRGAETGADVTRFDAASALADRVINAAKAAAPGRVTMGGDWKDSSPIDVDAYGAEASFTFLYRRPVYEDAAIWAAAGAANPVPTSPPRPDQPQGPTPYNFAVTADTEAGTRP
jgi:hypothetical protein